MSHKEVFENRLSEIDKDFKVKKDGKAFVYELSDVSETYSLIGLAAHFKNREWIKDYGYIYIMKHIVEIYY